MEESTTKRLLKVVSLFARTLGNWEARRLAGPRQHLLGLAHVERVLKKDSVLVWASLCLGTPLQDLWAPAMLEVRSVCHMGHDRRVAALSLTGALGAHSCCLPSAGL